ncbi:MAG: hypothetical protein H5T64_11580 [Chloroflexi bacterium]|nr:hypothetical protein [Chloroflexota bacterium]
MSAVRLRGRTLASPQGDARLKAPEAATLVAGCPTERAGGEVVGAGIKPALGRPGGSPTVVR